MNEELLLWGRSKASCVLPVVYYKELVKICDRKGIVALSKCVQDIVVWFMKRVEEKGGLTAPLNYPVQKPAMKIQVKVYAEDYYNFQKVCEKLGYKKPSNCLRDAIILWLKEEVS